MVILSLASTIQYETTTATATATATTARRTNFAAVWEFVVQLLGKSLLHHVLWQSLLHHVLITSNYGTRMLTLLMPTLQTIMKLQQELLCKCEVVIFSCSILVSFYRKCNCLVNPCCIMFWHMTCMLILLIIFIPTKQYYVYVCWFHPLMPTKLLWNYNKNHYVRLCCGIIVTFCI